MESCKEVGLPDPEMKEVDGIFSITLFKNILSEEQLEKLGLNEQQMKAILYVKENRKITNEEYQELNKVSKRTASNDLTELISNFSIFKKRELLDLLYFINQWGKSANNGLIDLMGIFFNGNNSLGFTNKTK